ncbi:MAG: flagellar biosynthesis anti-sigma factor FlgM [Solirubrobacteraceae bacterium]
MDETHKLKIASIKDEIEQGTYWVDETAVADAIMRRLREIREFARARATGGG